MRIIKAAKKADEITSTCYLCTSVLGVREVDLEWKDSAWSYLCPVCNIRNYFNNQDKLELFPWTMEEDEDEVSNNNAVRVHTL